MGPRSYIHTWRSQQLGHSLQIPGQAGRGREDAPAGVQGYEKVLGLENAARRRPVLKLICNLGGLFTAQGHLDKAKEMYSRGLTGLQALLGPSSEDCQLIERKIAFLDATQGK